MEGFRSQKISILLEKYKSIAAVLLKVESLVAGTGTCRSPSLLQYYEYWEKRIYNAIVLMIVRGLATMKSLFQVGQRSNKCVLPSICKVKAVYAGKDIVLNPPISELSKYFFRIVKNLVESAKAFIRWNQGSCIISGTISMGDYEPPFNFTFYDDISRNPYISKIATDIGTGIQSILGEVEKYLSSWKYFDNVHGLWDSKRRAHIAKIKDTNPKINFFDSQLSVFNALAQDVHEKPVSTNFNFLQVDASPVIASIAKEARYWRDQYGAVLLSIANEKLLALSDQYDKSRIALNREPSDLHALKRILNVVQDIEESKMEWPKHYAKSASNLESCDKIALKFQT